MWEHVPCDQPLCSISCGPVSDDINSNSCLYFVWAVAKNGSAYWRLGITDQKPQGIL